MSQTLAELVQHAFQDSLIYRNPSLSRYIVLIGRLSGSGGIQQGDEATLWELVQQCSLKEEWVRLGLSLLNGGIDVGDVGHAVEVYKTAHLHGGLDTLRILHGMKEDKKREEEIAEQCYDADVAWIGLSGDIESVILSILKKRDQLAIRQVVRELVQLKEKHVKLGEDYASLQDDFKKVSLFKERYDHHIATYALHRSDDDIFS